MDAFLWETGCAEEYAEREIEGTSDEMGFLEARRMLGNLKGKTVLDFGCGAGRSTRFIEALGPAAVAGVDHNAPMIREARRLSGGRITYRLVSDSLPFPNGGLDACFSSYAFVEIKSLSAMQASMAEISRILRPSGLFVLMTVNPGAFGCRFKSGEIGGDAARLRSGETVTTTIRHGSRSIKVEDVYWTESDYATCLERAGFRVEEIAYPKARDGEDWVDEKEVAPAVLFKARKIRLGTIPGPRNLHVTPDRPRRINISWR